MIPNRKEEEKDDDDDEEVVVVGRTLTDRRRPVQHVESTTTTSTDRNNNNNSGGSVGVGVHAKHFERVVLHLLQQQQQIQPMDSVPLPNQHYHLFNNNNNNNNNNNGHPPPHPTTNHIICINQQHREENGTQLVEEEDRHDNDNDSNTIMNDTTTMTRLPLRIQLQQFLQQQLPSVIRFYGKLSGQIMNHQRAQYKENQIISLLQCIIPFVTVNHRTTTSSTFMTTTTISTTTTIDTGANIQQNGSVPSPVLPQPSSSTTTTLPLTSSSSSSPYTIVDFGGGTGHLSMIIAILLPQCRIICVDLGRQSLNLLHIKATRYINYINNKNDKGNHNDANDEEEEEPTAMYDSYEMDCTLRPTSISNLYTYYGPVHTFIQQPQPQYSYDMAIALHLCGEATDVTIQLSALKRTACIIVASCCVGKLSSSAHNPYIYQATGSNHPTIQYPQSLIFQNHMQSQNQPQNHQDRNDWDALAEAADYSEYPVNHDYDDKTTTTTIDHCHRQQLSLRRMAKRLLETDRCYYLQETHGYKTVLTQMEPIHASSPKYDIIVAWLPQQQQQKEEGRSMDDEIYTIFHPNNNNDHPIHSKSSNKTNTTTATATTTTTMAHSSDPNFYDDNVDSSRSNIATDSSVDEEEQIRQQLHAFIALVGTGSHDDNDDDNNTKTATATTSNRTFVFPTGMGRRRRKIIHYIVSNEFNHQLRHWSVGKKNADKTVAVAMQ